MLRTWSGKLAPLTADPADGEVCILDMTVVSGRISRFGNNGDVTWTDLHHAQLTSFIALRLGYGPIVSTYCQVHDQHESVLGFDMPQPVKAEIRAIVAARIPDFDPLKELEQTIDGRIYAHLHLPPPTPEQQAQVKYCDRIAGVIESVLFGPVDCDLNDVLPEADRPDMLAVCERVVPGFQKLVRKRL